MENYQNTKLKCHKSVKNSENTLVTKKKKRLLMRSGFH